MERNLLRRGWRETITFSIKSVTTWWSLPNAKSLSSGAWTESRSSWHARREKRKRLPKRRLWHKRGSIITTEAILSRIKIAMSIKIMLRQAPQSKVKLAWMQQLESPLLLELPLPMLERNLLLQLYWRLQLLAPWWKVWSQLSKNRKLLQWIVRSLNLELKSQKEEW